MYPPDGLLTFEETKHDVKYDLHIIATDPLISDIDDVAPVDLLLTTTGELKMNTSEDELLSGLNGRLRPRKSQIPSPQGKSKIKPDGKPQLDKRTSTPSKTSPNKEDNVASKPASPSTSQFLCPYCDRKLASRQTVSKHVRRIHYSTPKQETLLNCLFCNHTEADSNIIRHMVNSHPNQYFACLDCHTRFPSTSELAEHKLNVCEKQKNTYRTKPRSKIRGTKKAKKSMNISAKNTFAKHGKDFQEGHGFNGIVISCELKPPQDHDAADIERNITTNLILPHSKNLGGSAVLEKNAVIVLDDVQWNKRLPPNFSFHNTDPDQILSRLGVVHRSPRTGESTKKDWFKVLDDATQKFERCFDTKFYSKVASNVQENLAKYLDGSFNFNPDPDSTIKTRKSKNNVVINTAEGFPILLAAEQYSRNAFDSYLPRTIAPKHKWKWDNLENDRSLMTAADILKRDSHTNNCIITLVSSLDIWTQLSMRRKYDSIFNVQPVEKKTEKRNIISQELKEILESREIPTPHTVKKCISKPAARSGELEFPLALGLVPAAPAFELQPAVLSGEWVRPRCLVCCACGEQTTDSKGLSMHMSTRHPNANVQCYEIVGEPLLNADILKHLYVPPSQVCNRTRPPRGFRECTKCNKSVTLDDLHQHMLDCAGDTPAVRRRQPRQRPFGVRKRRPRLPDNTIRKKIRKDIRSRQRRQKTHGGPRPRIRTEVGDAETIRKMLADLPAKRHRVLVNPLNTMQRPRRKLDKQRAKLMLKKCSAEEVKIRKQDVRKRKSRENDATTSRDDSQKHSLEDDEDNEPLKPKIKFTCAARRREPLKRQIVISKARRKSLRTGIRKAEIGDRIIDGSGSIVQENCLDKSPQTIDLKKASYNTRDHASNCGSSGNRDGQRPGCSGTNGTANNSCAPTQNVPLKHSIARLTANSETHDKSVQFHHSFLVQQECNNTNQHVPTGERTLFENEAVVSKLDKPPLNFCHKDGYLEIHSNQINKNKSNKPRKGLNDCIAMLKNKLVDPLPCQAAGYVSVQCGSDEPIDDEPRIAIKTSFVSDITSNVDLHTESMQAQANLSALPQYEQENTDDKIQSPQDSQNQENENIVLPCGQKTTKSLNQNPEILPSQEKHEQELNSAKNKQSLKTLSKKSDVSPQLMHDIQKMKPNLESFQEKLELLPLYGQDNFQKVKEALSQDKLVPQYREETTKNTKQTSPFSQSQEKLSLITQFGQDASQNVKHVLELEHSQEQANSIQPFRHESFPSAKPSADYSNFQDHVTLIHPYRQEANQKVKSLQFQGQVDIMPQIHEISPNLQQHSDFLPLPVNLSASSQFRRESTQKITQETMQFSDKSTLCSLYQNREHILQNSEALHHGKANLEPHYKPVSARRKLSDEVITNSSLEERSVPVSCEIPKTNKKGSPKRRFLHDIGIAKSTEPVKQIGKRQSTETYVEIDATRKDKHEIRAPWQTPFDVFPVTSGTLQPSTSYPETIIHNNSNVENDVILPQSLDMFTVSRMREIPANIPPAHANNIVESIVSAPLDLSSKVFKSQTHLQCNENYDTLDLSNKNASRNLPVHISGEENVVVDLRVKPLHSRSSPVTLDLCVKAGSSRDVTVAIPDSNLPSGPTDLSVKGTDTFIKSIELTTVPVQDLSASSSTNLRVARITHPSKENIYQNDNETISKEIRSDLSEKLKTSKTLTPSSEQEVTSEQNEVTTSKPEVDSSQTSALDKMSSQLQKHVFDPTLRIPQYKIRTNIPKTKITSLILAEHSAHVMTSSIPHDLNGQNVSIGSNRIYSSASSTSAPPLNCTDAIPDRPIMSHGSGIDSTTHLYTANTSKAGNKREGSNAGSLLITSASSSTVPARTLTSKKTVSPKAFLQELDNDSDSSTESQNDDQSDSPAPTYPFEDEDSDDFTLYIDPKLAEKIALLPKELVKILGKIPEGHRDQLLNILPQYLSTTAANNAIEANQRIRDYIASIPRKKKLRKTAKSDRIIPSQSLHRREEACSSRQVIDEQKHNVPYKSRPPISEMNDSYKRSVRVNQNAIDYVEDSSNNLDRIIDLTKDDILPVPKVTEVSSSSSMVPQEPSCSEKTSTPRKKKENYKTASLRAVRIKAPSLRQKEKRNLSLVSEERVLAQNEQDAVIQLAEMSMAQLDSKSEIDIKEVNIHPISSTEDSTKETIELPTTSTDTLDDKMLHITTVEGQKDDNPDTLCDLNMKPNKRESDVGTNRQVNTNTIMVTPNIEQKTCVVYHSCDDNIYPENKIPTPENKIPTPENKTPTPENKIPTPENKTPTPENKTPTPENKIPIPENKIPIPENKIAEADKEEDSEDDIILATIVKQKLHSGSQLNNESTKKKIKKKSRKSMLMDDTKVDNKATLPCQDSSVLEDSLKNKVEQNLTSTSLIKYTEREEPKRKSDINANNSRETQLLEVNSNAESSGAIAEKYGKENDDNLTNMNRKIPTETVSAKSQEALLPKLAFNSKQKGNVLQKNKSKKDKTLPEQKCYNIIDQEKTSNQSQITIATSKPIGLEKENVSQSQMPPCSNLVSKTDDLLVTPEKKLKSEETKSNIDRSEKNSSNLSKDNSSESREDENSSDAPLRRSRRGKSIYLEGTLTAQENLNIDINLDQKAPLTKKQLIFSKLLLDEEKQIKSSILDVNKSDASSKIPEITPQQCQTDISEETQKCKPVKRKISSRLKKNNKKKKSIDDNISEDALLTIESDSNTKCKKDIVSVETTESIEANAPIPHTNKDIAGHVNNEKVQKEEIDSNSILPNDHIDVISNKANPEKRKISKLQHIVELDQTLKTKKTKFNKSKEDDLCDDLEKEEKISTLEVVDEGCEKPELSTMTCYDVPVAARKTRSKSVAIKPSEAESYDPYDIDLDDMIQKSEPVRKPGLKAKEVKRKRKYNSKLADIDVDKKEPITISTKNNKIKSDSLEPRVKKTVCEQDSNTEKALNMTVSDVKSDENTDTPTTYKLSKLAVKDATSDSDESSKSDVPLKKYVEGRVKKLAATSKVSVSDVANNVNKTESSQSKKSTHTDKLKNDSSADLSVEIEQQMRSEQFMESFGFFSERKPRKSNLLATKKISETFHIIANEGEDSYYSSKERPSKKSLQIDTKNSSEGSNTIQPSTNKCIKRGRKKKTTETAIRYCNVCKKEFQRPDNYSRHLITLLHVSKLSEVELKLKTVAIPEEPNYLIAFKQQMNRLKILTDKAAKQKKNSKTKIVLPSLDEVLAEVRKMVREQQLARRGLSRDEALFLDCCELLNKPCRPDVSTVTTSDPNFIQFSAQSSMSDLNFASKSLNRSNINNDDDVDSITAKNIMESEEVRYLENNLISGLHQIASVKHAHKKDEYHATPCTMTILPHEISPDIYSKSDCDIHCQQMKILSEDFGTSIESNLTKTKKLPEYKEKMYPDIIEDIDMFEDKFDKIKRKCRSQAAAAKQVQCVTEPSPGNKGRKKIDKKKRKKGSKKNNQNTVMTKGALKGFDGIKVSIPTSDINMSAIGVVLHESSQKNKRKVSSKKKREKDFGASSKLDSDHLKSNYYSQKKVDVYEFMDNEDAELFEFRPSTLMERFKSINKVTPCTSKRNVSVNDPDNSSESASDGDDFVYMSDDYVCSDDETENSLQSSELGNGKNDAKKSTPLKRKDVVEKNAVMGKIFKNNAVRSEKRIVKNKETVNPDKANLDQLFDSLLKEEPNSSLPNDSSKVKEIEHKKEQKSSPKSERNDDSRAKSRKSSFSYHNLDTSSKNIETEHNQSIIHDTPERDIYGPSSSKQAIDIHAPSSSGTYIAPLHYNETSKKQGDSLSKRHEIVPKSRKSFVRELVELKNIHAKSHSNILNESEHSTDFDEDTGVARHRARRKCTVGKQNVLAETWSSESEPDGLPPRPASADSVVSNAGRKKKGRKKDGQQTFGRRGKVIFNKKHDIESRVNSNKWSTADSGATSHIVVDSERSSAEREAAASAREACPPPAPPGPAPASASAAEASTSKARPRPTAYYWTSEGDDEQEHQQQHGWIVGNSHKRLVTMLAHAKGRKRNNDDKRHLVE